VNRTQPAAIDEAVTDRRDEVRLADARWAEQQHVRALLEPAVPFDESGDMGA
jgi:hypothetical protein